MSPITTHVLDIAVGRPVEGIVIVLERQSPADAWTEVGRGATNSDGRLTTLASSIAAGVYRLRFLVAPYFTARGQRCFYPEIAVLFQLDDASAHYHVPLLLSPFGYSTYRGS